MKPSIKQERCTPVYYPLKEEIACAVTHGLGALFGIYALIMMILRSAQKGDAWAVVAGAVYGGALIILYTISTLSHALTNRSAKKVFRILDHATIFLLIAGTYTPISLITLKGALGWVVFGLQWALAAIGIVFGSIALNRFKRISTLIYILMGWAIILAITPLLSKMPPAGFYYLLGGGLFYTGGLIFYRRRGPYMHFLWHLFALIGSLLQFAAVYLFVLPITYH